ALAVGLLFTEKQTNSSECFMQIAPLFLLSILFHFKSPCFELQNPLF
ncbi:hypothetical protein HMPREF0653_00560, partial [Prevotella disiens JCM 6334 = ATCC 29426]